MSDLEARIADDRIIAALARETIELREKVSRLERDAQRRSEWLDEAKRAAGAHYNTSFDDVWAEALQALREKRSAEKA